jgi:hypothetical protein
MRKHIFSEKHVTDGIRKLGSSEENIIKKIANIILKADDAALLKEKANQLLVDVGGNTVTVRFFVEKGRILMLDFFMGTADRKIGNYVDMTK